MQLSADTLKLNDPSCYKKYDPSCYEKFEFHFMVGLAVTAGGNSLVKKSSIISNKCCTWQQGICSLFHANQFSIKKVMTDFVAGVVRIHVQSSSLTLRGP